MFQRILIANRAEIACRIARTCARLGIDSVAVYSRADADALHTRSATHAVALDAAGAAEGYLDGARIIAAARECGAEAIHPGYGFLAENADFAQACASAGICFIGPPASAMRDMGDKAQARRRARAAGVPVVPGVEEGAGAARADRDHVLARAAAALAFPLLIKACAGGGGRGMRRVDSARELPGAIAAARREALAGFGDDALIVERCIARPRHVEVQILADHHGTVLHLHERDCSIQRRHQKLIEEAPAPGLAAATREALHAAALTLARAIDYRNAGTVEFILDPHDGSLHFLEMNTRLQVEHAVTEAILGLDLVEWQIRIAAGEALPFRQEALRPRGWAMEARINAEDPAQDFQPAIGTVIAFRPARGPGVRIDSGVACGTRVDPFYDSMLAKLIVHGDERADAATRLARALEASTLMGVRSNMAFLAALVRLPAFRNAVLDTDFIPEQFPEGWRAPLSRADLAMAAALCVERAAAAVSPEPWRALRGFRVTAAAGYAGRWRVLLDDAGAAPLAVWVWHDANSMRMAVTERSAPPPAANAGTGVRARWHGSDLEMALDTRRSRLVTLAHDGCWHLYGPAGWHAFRVLDRAGLRIDGGADGAATAGPLIAPVPGVVVSVEVQVGDMLAAGAAVLVLESMKMYRTVHAPSAARVESVHCAAGDAVSAGQLLVTLQAPGSAEAALPDSAA